MASYTARPTVARNTSPSTKVLHSRVTDLLRPSRSWMMHTLLFFWRMGIRYIQHTVLLYTHPALHFGASKWVIIDGRQFGAFRNAQVTAGPGKLPIRSIRPNCS